MIFVYLFASSRKKEIPIWLTMLCFFMIFYNGTLNYMRQSLAISVILYSIVKFQNKKYKLTALFFVIALTIHNSAIFALPIYYILFNRNNKKIIIATILALIVLVFSYEKILYYLAVVLKIIPYKYYGYVSSYGTKVDIGYFDLLYRLIVLFIYYINKKIKTNKEKNDIFAVFTIIDLLILPITFKVSNANRIGLYYFYLSALTILPKFMLLFKKDKFNRLSAYIFLFSILLLYWYRTYVYLGYSATMPYKTIGLF